MKFDPHLQTCWNRSRGLTDEKTYRVLILVGHYNTRTKLSLVQFRWTNHIKKGLPFDGSSLFFVKNCLIFLLTLPLWDTIYLFMLK